MCLDLDGIDKASHYKHVNNPKSELKLPGPSGSEAGHRTCSNQSMCNSIIFLFVFLIGKEQTWFFFLLMKMHKGEKKDLFTVLLGNNPFLFVSLSLPHSKGISSEVKGMGQAGGPLPDSPGVFGCSTKTAI